MAGENKQGSPAAAKTGEQSRIEKMQAARKYRSQKVAELDPQQKQALRLVVSGRQLLDTIEKCVINQQPVPQEVFVALGGLQSASAAMLYA